MQTNATARMVSNQSMLGYSNLLFLFYYNYEG